MRLSVTDLCNLRCIYCMPEGGTECLSNVLEHGEIADIVAAAAACGITKVRVTGGEPLLRSDIIELCRTISQTNGIRELCLTTNGSLLQKYAADLKNAGVHRLNLSLDALDSSTYRKITRNGSLQDALDGLRAAFEAGFDAIKINAVLLGGVNDDEILKLLDMTRNTHVNVRFIEVMPVGQSADWGKFVSAQKILELAPELCDIGADGVAKLYKLPGGLGTVGLISPISSHFCPTCNKIRVSADGKLKPCLHTEEEINLRGLGREELMEVIRAAVRQKPAQHNLSHGEISQSRRGMNAIGG